MLLEMYGLESPYACIITGGESPEPGRIRPIVDRASLLIAADRGYDRARDYGCTPDIWVGDFDSTKLGAEKQKFKGSLVSLAVDKDQSDTEAALDIAASRGFRNRVLIGGGEGRLDHIVAIIALFYGDFPPTLWITRNETVFALEEELVLEEKINTEVSFLPLEKSKVQSQGLRWELDTVAFQPGTMSLSNRFANPRVRLRLLFGSVLVLLRHPESAS